MPSVFENSDKQQMIGTFELLFMGLAVVIDIVLLLIVSEHGNRPKTAIWLHLLTIGYASCMDAISFTCSSKMLRDFYGFNWTDCVLVSYRLAF